MISWRQGLFRFRPVHNHTSTRTYHLHFSIPRFKQRSLAMQSSEEQDKETRDEGLKQKLELIGIHCRPFTPGQYHYLICPKCKGEKSMERTLSFHINQNEKFAMWRCFNFECGWAGQVLADVEATQGGIDKVEFSKQITEETLRLEPLGDQLIEYFAERMISTEVLQKNGVMQTQDDDEDVIAFTYRRHGELVNCKFRSITSKRFWQVKGAERILYGLDDLDGGDEIVIVEGEIDKLSMEQAGIQNCVSVPDGAPQKISAKALPSIEQDGKFKYIWNCKEYLDKASRIVLATDGDGPGQVLAEELARRLGRERCWLVTWPKKDESSCYKDANEVIKHLGAEELRHMIRTAKLYDVSKSF